MYSPLQYLTLTLILPLLTTSTPIQPHEPPCGSCLTPSEIYPISHRWLDSFASNGLWNLEYAATENVQYWNEEFTYPGCPTPYAEGRQQLYDIIAGTAQTWTACSDISFEIVSAWAGCDRIAVRWRQKAVVSGKDENATAEAGTPVLFSGIDLLTVDLNSRLVSNAETSSDRINYYNAIGMNPFMH